MKKNKIQVYTDGACKGNPGIGGWGVLVLNTEKNYELKGCELNTTNNRMELIAVINGLKSIKETTDIDLLTDSKYVKNGINDWISIISIDILNFSNSFAASKAILQHEP